MFDANFSILPKAMDASVAREKVLAQNIANYNTPGYKRKTVSFEDELSKALGNSEELQLRTKNSSHINNTLSFDKVQPVISEDNAKSYRTDGNNVDIEVEGNLMMQNSLNYTALTRSLSNVIARYKTVIRP